MMPQVGKLYKHYKGGIYHVIAIAEHTETKESFVIYQSPNSAIVWARPLSNFAEVLGGENENTWFHRFEELS
ncbi:DUF1653 domain-containing protein [Floridanema evergladense]|uniref:DUF1653 domain-containing protein n=1 Tax=Floridaenema evergladense BLCC-F167 TaxID=3153639 RepID=A0ABV4WCZ0_9CYAN